MVDHLVASMVASRAALLVHPSVDYLAVPKVAQKVD